MIGLLILARMGSSRLAQKHLIEANHQPLLYWLIKRFEQEFEQEIKAEKVCMVIATSEKPENKGFSVITENTSCNLFQGADDNIPLRHLQCSKHFNLTHVISIDGDDIFCSTHAARIIYEQMIKDTEHNYFTVSGLPLGMNLSGYAFSYLEESIRIYAQNNKKLETGWGRIFKNPATWQQTLDSYDIMGDLRFTLDYPEDAAFFCEVINQLKEKIISILDEELIKFVIEKELYKINAFLKEQYWSNYNSEKQKELDEQK